MLSDLIAVVKGKKTLGVGAGQVNRIWAVENAISRSFENVEGAVLASDAFFPFDDCVTTAASAGIKAIIQPGGSMRDEDSIKKAEPSSFRSLSVNAVPLFKKASLIKSYPFFIALISFLISVVF